MKAQINLFLKDDNTFNGIIELPGIIQFRKCSLDNKALAEKSAIALNKAYCDGHLPSRHIPARPDEDFDLLIGEMAYRLFFLDLQSVRDTLLMCSLIDKSGQAMEQVKRLDDLLPFLNGQTPRLPPSRV